MHKIQNIKIPLFSLKCHKLMIVLISYFEFETNIVSLSQTSQTSFLIIITHFPPVFSILFIYILQLFSVLDLYFISFIVSYLFIFLLLHNKHLNSTINDTFTTSVTFTSGLQTDLTVLSPGSSM